MVSVSLLTATAVRADDPFDPGHPIEPGSYTLTLLVSDAKMGTVSGAGSYTHGTTVEIEATPNTDYQFIQWSDGVCTNPRNVDILSDLTLTAEFDDEANAVSLLNGYVDPYHPDYYKKNARIKDIKITDENGKDYFFTLKDEVRVQTFMLDNCTKKVTLTVLSVYAGEKYGDIALSMFAGVYADTYIDWIVFRELEAAKERAESAYHSYLWNLENYPKNIPHDCSLIKSEWTMYYMTVEDRIKKEFGGKFAEHDIEIYDSPDLKIHLAVVYHNIVTVFYAKEKITKYGYEFKNMPDIISGPFEDDDYEYSSYATEKDGWIISAFWYGAGDTCALPVSARFKVMTESGKIRKVVISKEGLKGVKRFGELLIGASDLK